MAKPNVQTFILFCFNQAFGVAVRDWIKAHGFKARVVDARSWLGESEEHTVTVLVPSGATPDEMAKLKEIHAAYPGAIAAPYREWTDTPPPQKPEGLKGDWVCPPDQKAARATALKICGVSEPDTKSDGNAKSDAQPQG